MKNNELRIGNLVYYNGEIVTITGITKEHPFINMITVDYLEWEEIYPVLITKERLLELGFKLYPSGNYCKDINDTDNYLGFDIENHLGSVWLNIGDEGVRIQCEFIHELQNLYFALTNNELKVLNSK